MFAVGKAEGHGGNPRWEAGVRCMLEVIRRVLLCILEAVEGDLCLLEVPEATRCVLLCILEVSEAPEVMRRLVLCMLEAVEGSLCLLDVLEVLEGFEVPEMMHCVEGGFDRWRCRRRLEVLEVTRRVLRRMREAVDGLEVLDVPR